MIDVEKVAAVIARRDIFREGWEWAFDSAEQAEQEVEKNQEKYMPLARAAALEVLRQLEEPSEEMLKPWDDMNEADWLDQNALEIWSTMLRTARASLESPP